MGESRLISESPWPRYDPDLAKEETVTIVVQVNGKVRSKFQIERDAPAEEVKLRALGLERIRQFVGGVEPLKVILIPNRLVNIVVK